ncbi:MAG TPA: hypothetical protein DDX93_03765 [Smithella sp.]|nr:hypothetical protein [Smithella sp.]
MPLGEASFLKIVGLKLLPIPSLIEFYFIFFTSSTKNTKIIKFFKIIFYSISLFIFTNKNNSATCNNIACVFNIAMASDIIQYCSGLPVDDKY